MSRHGFTDLGASLRSGGDLTQILEAIQSGHLGAVGDGPPAYVEAGMTWVKQVDADTMELYLHVGGDPAVDLLMGTADLAAGEFSANAQTGVTTRQRLSGSGTFTVPTGVSRIRVMMVGAGGGGDADGASDGSDGGDTSFGAFTANGGKAGEANSNAGAGGAGGGTGCAGNPGGFGSDNEFGGGSGGFGGGALPGQNGTDGGGGGGQENNGGGGGGGLNIQEIDTTPGATFAYNCGSGGAGAAPGSGSGGDGFIIVEF